MFTLVSKRHWLKFYGNLVLGILIFIFIGCFSIYFFNDLKSKGQLVPKNYWAIPLSIFSFLMVFYMLYVFIKNCPKIEVDKKIISFNKETFYWSDIEFIELTGKRQLKYSLDSGLEGAILRFKGGEVKFIIDYFYANSSEIKSFIQQTVIDKLEYKEYLLVNINKETIQSEFFIPFKGFQLSSLRGIIIWGLLCFSVFTIFSKNEVELIAFFVMISVFFTLSLFLNYFEISDSYFVVKNHNLLWRKKVYALVDVKEAVFETQRKMPNCLRIITKDFKSKLYPAGTLSNKTWFELRDELEKKGIVVRNECIS